jgi:antitoxin component YwqK of YwqJK toxin-antitoxin module
MKRLFFFLIVGVFFSCHNSKHTKTGLDCINAVVDEKFQVLAQFNKDFYDENYTGTVVSYYDEEDQKIRWILYYENGEIIKYESFYENGDPKILQPIKCNSINGKMIYYTDNGKIGYDLDYKLGRKDGIGRTYFENGKIKKIVRYENDLKNGEQVEFSENGDTILVELYENGILK